MLGLGCKVGSFIRVSVPLPDGQIKDIDIHVTRGGQQSVRMGFECDADVKVLRGELLARQIPTREKLKTRGNPAIRGSK